MKVTIRSIISPAALLLLAGCGSGGEQDPAAAAADNVEFRPGRWQVGNTIAGGVQQKEYLCITAEQARSGTFLAGDLPEGCTVGRNVVADGRIDLAIQCGPGDQAMRSTVQGTYGADTYKVDTTIDMGAGQAMRATSSAAFVSKECREGDIGQAG